MKSSARDKWGRPLNYRYPGTHHLPYDLWTFGADGKDGGARENADIGNWNDEQLTRKGSKQ